MRLTDFQTTNLQRKLQDVCRTTHNASLEHVSATQLIWSLFILISSDMETKWCKANCAKGYK